VSEAELADAAQLASLPDETPEGRSIVVLAKEKYNIRGREMAPMDAHFIPFSAHTRLSGIDIEGASIRKGAVDAVLAWARTMDNATPAGGGVAAAVRPVISDAVMRELHAKSDEIAKAAARRSRWHATASCWRHLPEGHRQRWHPRALRGTAADGHPDGDDHRDNPLTARRSRRKPGGRFPCAGYSRNEAEADPR